MTLQGVWSKLAVFAQGRLGETDCSCMPHACFGMPWLAAMTRQMTSALFGGVFIVCLSDSLTSGNFEIFPLLCVRALQSATESSQHIICCKIMW